MIGRKLTTKQRAWLAAYTECLNATEAARRAGYRCKNPDSFATIGKENFRKLQPLIEKYLDEHDLSEAAIKARIAEGMRARETKFFAFEGKVTDQREVAALGIRQRYVDMAARVRSMYDRELLARLERLERLLDHASTDQEEAGGPGREDL